jgi:CRISPR system Cascade subunit CasC
MFVELHLLQNFAPSCLNRDDTNSPKDCEFGGYRRARISSQCIKRAIRSHFRTGRLFAEDELAERTKLLVKEAARQLVNNDRTEEQAEELIRVALGSVKLKTDGNGETKYLLFLGRKEIAGLVKAVSDHWDELSKAKEGKEGAETAETSAPKETAREQKQRERKAKAAAQAAGPPEVKKAVEGVLDGGKAADLALFGRMIADLPGKNVDAACQVAHAISTNKVDMDLDFFTAVDDLKTRNDEAGAGMMGTVEFNSSCFYRYANIDVDQLRKNLQDDKDLCGRTLRAFLRASIEAIPTGKQNSMAAHNPPSFIFAVVRERGLWSLANAFVQPVRPDWPKGDGLVQNSIGSLDKYWGQLHRVYGSTGIQGCVFCSTESVETTALKEYQVDSALEVIERVMKELDLAPGKEVGE